MSAAAILMFAFFVLASTPGTGALLVPALRRLLGEWNWWLPRPFARALFVDRGDAGEPALESE